MGVVAMSAAIKHEAWIVRAQIDAGELPAFDEDSHLAAWFESEYEWPAMYIDEGGQG
jgi:hypothetical protein